MQFIPVRFKELRAKLGLSQTEIAEKLEMVQPAWARFEAGGVPDPRCSSILLICKTFGISADWLLGLVDNDDMYAINNYERMYSNVIDLICNYEKEGLLLEHDVDKIINDINDIKESIDKQ